MCIMHVIPAVEQCLIADGVVAIQWSPQLNNIHTSYHV